MRETANLEAFRAASEARVKLDSLEPAQLAAAVEGFEKAVRLDPRYAIAYAGLANAHFLLYEATRARNAADASRLATAIGHARRAVDLDDTLAEGHATLAFLLVSAGRFAEAVAAARRAVALEPQDWRHLFRLGHAAWGSERLDALRRALAIYGELAFVHFEIAMVHIARGQLALADGRAAPGHRAAGSAGRPLVALPGLGAALAARAWCCWRRATPTRPSTSSAARSKPARSVRLYGHEFVMNAHDGRGFALLVAAAAGRGAPRRSPARSRCSRATRDR